MIYIRPFRVSDFEAFEPIEPLATAEIKDPAFAQAIEDSCLAVTGVRDGEVIGCAGVHPVEDDDFNGEMWLRLSPDCLKHKLDTLRWIRDGLKIIEETFPFGQLNATIKCCFTQSIKMVEYLGFKRVREVEHEGKQWFIYSKRIAI
ncbi:hypothetical protein LCGC14_2552450 [marine sediment metagenome]|uniref:N-acetyltransferase domain-containing protein n=1 Tax=marine sediment metagenome TaxID=412755 RepID=A0A0F9AN38_9ZZZZ